MEDPWWLDGAPAVVRETYARARAGEPTAMIRIGGCAAGLDGADDALRWFDAAFRTGHPAAGRLERVMTDVRPDDRAPDHPSAWRWHTRSANSRVWVWPGVLGSAPPGDEVVDPALLVVTAQIEDAFHAVDRAGSRVLEATEEGYAPNGVSTYTTALGPAVAVDTKGFGTPARARTMVTRVVEELEWARVAALVTRMPDDLDRELFVLPSGWQSWALPHDTEPRVALVRRVTADIDGTQHPLYRRPNGTWTDDPGTAQAFTDQSYDRLLRLWQEIEPGPDIEPVSFPVGYQGDWPSRIVIS